MLRQIDPDLRIGANGPSNKNGVSEVEPNGQKWWPYVLQTAGSSIDFVICHSYPVMGWTYDTYQQNSINFQVGASGEACMTLTGSPFLSSHVRSVCCVRMRACMALSRAPQCLKRV